MAAITISRRALIIIGAAVVALLVVLVILVSVLLATVNRAASEDDYRQCMSDRNVSARASGETVEQYADRAAAAAASCSR